jgi:hypothetical protein
MIKLIVSLILLISTTSLSAQLPIGAIKYGPILVAEQHKYWHDDKSPVYIFGQVEQETCLSINAPHCWQPTAELRTSREYGFGLGQFTITSKFNTFNDVKKLDSSLSTWKYTDRYNPELQLRALVLKDKQLFDLIKDASTDLDRKAFMFAAYNGGYGGVLSDKRVCLVTKNCNPNKWFGNVEYTSNKAHSAIAEYKNSFFSINRSYVSNILLVRSNKYKQLLN